ncbi:MAG: site-specific integrase [Alphaproteobacteria bacterium]|nr:site-specific integrase [Alphaproteobacteria bacterium]
MNPPDKVQEILRQELTRRLEDDIKRRLGRSPGTPVYAYWLEPEHGLTPQEADLKELRDAISSYSYALATNQPDPTTRDVAEELAARHNLPADAQGRLALGLLEVALQAFKTIEQRTLGLEPLVFSNTDIAVQTAPTPAPAAQVSVQSEPEKPALPCASALIGAFCEWAQASGGWRPNAVNQAKKSIELLIEIVGDKPIDRYERANGDLLRTTLRQLPSNYRKSPKDKDKSLAEIIQAAKENGAALLGERTIKRHFWAVSRFFAFLTETGKLPRATENIGRGFTFNTKGVARTQRDQWEGEELRTLFASPIWTGCHTFYRAKSGSEIIRDSRFWLPLLGLFHGNRLEEFAQLRREDVRCQDGIWFLRITDEGERQLKNEQSRRNVPLHSELIKIGFLKYVEEMAKAPQDLLFPDLKPGGTDKKLGFYFSKQFSAYRKSIRLHRKGLDYHAFRHGVTTKLYEADVNEGWIDLLTGHESGSESRRRYLKGISLPSLKGAIEKVAWPEIDLSHLYVDDVKLSAA